MKVGHVVTLMRLVTATWTAVVIVLEDRRPSSATALLVLGRSFVIELRRVEDHYRTRSRELTPAEGQHRPRRQRVLHNLLRLTSAVP